MDHFFLNSMKYFAQKLEIENAQKLSLICKSGSMLLQFLKGSKVLKQKGSKIIFYPQKVSV